MSKKGKREEGKEHDEREQLRLRYIFEDLDPDLVRLLRLIKSGDALPYNVPPEVAWPKGEKGYSARAALLIRCGERYLEEKYGPKETAAQSSEKPQSAAPRKGAEAAARSHNPFDSL